MIKGRERKENSKLPKFNRFYRTSRTLFFKKIGHARPLFYFFEVFSKQRIQVSEQIDVKNVHLVNGAGIWTHDTLNRIFDGNYQYELFFKNSHLRATLTPANSMKVSNVAQKVLGGWGFRIR